MNCKKINNPLKSGFVEDAATHAGNKRKLLKTAITRSYFWKAEAERKKTLKLKITVSAQLMT